MDALKELQESVVSGLKTRLGNPLLVGFLVSWLVINFRVVLVLLGEGGARDKIRYVDELMYPHWYQWAWYGVAYPLLAATMYLLLSPFVVRWTTVFLKRQDVETAKALLAAEGTRPISEDRATLLRQSLAESRAARVRDAEAAALRIDELERQLTVQAKAVVQQDVALHDTPLAVNEGPNRQEEFPLLDSDFIGHPTKLPFFGRNVSLTRDQVQALYIISHGRPHVPVLEHLSQEEIRRGNAVAARLKALGLISIQPAGSDLAMRITDAGQLALAGAISRGFTPT